MTADEDARFFVSAPRRQGQAMGFLNHNGDVVEAQGGAAPYAFEAAYEAAAGLAARLGRTVYIQPLLLGEIDVDADPISVAPPMPDARPSGASAP